MTEVVSKSLLLGSICAAAFALASTAGAQEVKQTPGMMTLQTAAVTPVSQNQLNNAAHDGSNFLLTNGNYEQTRFQGGNVGNAINSQYSNRPTEKVFEQRLQLAF